MSTRAPPRDDIVIALVSLGFYIGENTPTSTILSDGNYTVNVPFGLIHGKAAERLQDELDEILSYYALKVADFTDDETSENFDTNLKRVAAWIERGG
ncbi:hypothetical protein JXM67_09030 [candidate division WOR-3 bacterium]|nr:hypothetical protein [candidate division WOR-3 bacterium]